jgi:ribosomal protein S12 methylthiotransferase accessory factor
VADQEEAATRYWAGTHRLVSPAETLSTVQPYFPVMGITRVADITGLDTIGIPVVAVCRPNSRSVVVSLGKGLDLTTAKASGVMESVEAFVAERIIQPLTLGSVNDLRFARRLIDVELLPRPPDSLYHVDFPLLWIEGQDLVTRTRIWVPYELVHTAYTLPPPTGTGCFVATSNGLASGNHLLEAISHGICETVERDAVTLHELRTPEQRALRRIDPRTVDDAGCAEALGRLACAGMSVAIWDMTTDIRIPAFKCVIADDVQHPGRVRSGSAGMGCHPDRGIALLRALTEAAQARLAVISATRDEPANLHSAREAAPEAGHQQPTDLQSEAPCDFAAVPAFVSDSLDKDVAWELEALRSAGISDVVVVDLTREEFKVAVVRVIIPGLEGPAGLVSCSLGRRARKLINGR